MPSSHVSLANTISRIAPADAAYMRLAHERQLSLTKPPGSLGQLEEVSVRLAGIFRTDRPRIRGKAVIIAAADHGVATRGVTGYPQEVTAQMVLNFLEGGAAISVLCRQTGARQIIVDAGVAAALPDHPELRSLNLGRGTDDISQGAAMTRKQAEQCVEAGISLAMEAAESGADLIATGDMGIGNTTPSSAIVSAVTGKPPEETTGEGTGRSPDELLRKIEVVRTALQVNAPNPDDGLDLLSKVGGYEIGTLAGVALGAAAERRAVVLDGFISGAAALIAHALCPAVADYMIAAHMSAERGHRVTLAHLGLRPLLDLDMRLGEGSGAALALPIIEAAAACLSEMATFAEAGVSDRDSESDEG